MNPLGKYVVKNHTYTQEEAKKLDHEVDDLNFKMREKDDEKKELVKKFDLVLEMLTKEQLIEFIHKTM